MDIEALLRQVRGKANADLSLEEKVELMGAVGEVLIAKDEAAEAKWKAIGELMGPLQLAIALMNKETKLQKEKIKQLENRIEALEKDGATLDRRVSDLAEQFEIEHE